MKVLALEVTNRCNRACRHCFRNRADPPESLPLELAEQLLIQAKPLGIRGVCLTGGEVALYPQLGELVRLVTANGFLFTLVTNGHRFEDQVLPLLLEPEVKSRLASVCVSLDGDTAQTHDALRGRQSYAEAGEAAALCRRHHLPLSLKSVVTALNQEELEQLAHRGAQWGAREHEFIFPFPTPTLIREGLLPHPDELKRMARWIKNDLAGSVKSAVTVEGFAPEVVLNCGTVMNDLNVDYQGHLILCCQLSHVTMGDGVPNRFGGELVADLKEVPLREGIILQYRLAVKLIEERLANGGKPPGLSQTPCHWCLHHFGKLEWLKDFPDSPWAAGVLDG
jgi:MoaA/NifB/PqqE/SkfB family radical SAM enzyme